jgi:hypothetical protein
MVGLSNNILPAFIAFNSKEQCVKLAIELPCPSGQGINWLSTNWALAQQFTFG